MHSLHLEDGEEPLSPQPNNVANFNFYNSNLYRQLPTAYHTKTPLGVDENEMDNHKLLLTTTISHTKYHLELKKCTKSKLCSKDSSQSTTCIVA